MDDVKLKRIRRSIVEIAIAFGVITWSFTLYDHYFLPEYTSRLVTMTSGETGSVYPYSYLSIFSFPGIFVMHLFYYTISRTPLFFQILLPLCFIPQIIFYWGFGEFVGMTFHYYAKHDKSFLLGVSKRVEFFEGKKHPDFTCSKYGRFP